MGGVDASTFPSFNPFTKTWHSEPYPFISPTRPELSAAERNVVITGGGTGIGLAVATAFAQASAKSVTILGRRLDKLESGVATISAAIPKDSKTKILHEQADLLSREDTTRALNSIASRVDGKIDIFVSNGAGHVTDLCNIHDASDKALLNTFENVVLTYMHAIQAFLPLAGPEPILLSTNTCFAHWPAIPRFGLASFARTALLKLTDYIQAENQHVRVVSIQPGWVATAANGFQKEAPDSSDLPGHFYVWLASPEAAFLKGKFVWANWDAQELMERAKEVKNSKLLTLVLNGVDE